MPDDPPVFLTESRHEILRGRYNGNDSTRRSHETMIRARTLEAVEELIEVAASPNIKNRDAFNPESLGVLIAILTRGTGGLVDPDDDLENDMLQAWEPDEDFAREIYVEVDSALHGDPKEKVRENLDDSFPE